MIYDPKTIEQKWQSKWMQDNCFGADQQSDKPKYYVLCMFPIHLVLDFMLVILFRTQRSILLHVIRE